LGWGWGDSRRRLHRSRRPTVVGGGGGATPARERRRGLAGEVQGGERNPFRGSIGAEEGRNGGSTELRRRPAMVAAKVASPMVLGNGGWVVEGQREVENVVGCLDWRMGRRREELGVHGRRRRQWRAARCVTGGRRLVLAREVGRCPFIVAAREGEAGRTLAGGGPPGAARAGARSDRRGRRRGEQRTRRGACRAQVAPEGSGFGKTRGA